MEGYRLSIGALFDARQKVQASIKDQMGKYADHMVKTENQASEIDLISMVKGSVPTQYSYAANLEQSTSMDPPPTDRQVVPQAQERGRTRSRSRSRRRGRSSSRPAKRRNYQPERDYGFDRQPQQNFNPPRGQAAGGNSYSGQGARPKTQDRPNQNQGYRNDRDNLDPRFFTPELIQKIAEAYDGLHK